MRPAMLAAALLLAAPVVAQCYAIPDDKPDEGRCNWIPFGQAYGTAASSNQRYQTILTKADLGSVGGSITALQFAPCGGAPGSSGTYRIDAITIKMDHRAPGALSTTFDDNLSANAVTVLAVRDHLWPVTGDTWNGIGLQVPFVFDETRDEDVVVDITVTGTGVVSGTLGVGMRRHSGRQRVFDYGPGPLPATARFEDSNALKVRVCVDTAAHGAFGGGCPAGNPLTLSYSGSSRPGATLFVDISNAPAGVAWIMAGLTNAPPLPTDLTALNMPGCYLYISPTMVLAAPVAGGKAQLPLPIPNQPTLVATVFYNQAFALDPAANPAGTSTSNYGRAIVGN